MSEQKENNGAIETENGLSGQQERKPSVAEARSSKRPL